jgi:peptidoglycan-associated lipoprotein
MKKIESLLITLAATVALAACSSTPTTDAGAASSPAPAPSAAPASPPAAATAPSPANALVIMPLHKDPNSALSKQRSVYFDFDDATVKSEFNGLIENHGKYLQGNPRLTVRIEGNADERGSAEYNLALGQKRAESVVRALKIFGVKDSQMEPTSYGEERPVAAGQGESAWGQNRRADVVYRD